MDNVFVCSYCGNEEISIVTCPCNRQKYCADCYAKHAPIHRAGYAPTLIPLRPSAQGISIAREMHTKYKELNPNLNDTEGTPAPAATTPKVFHGGGGSPDDPPEAAGAPNRPRVEVRRKKS